jgi:hypothetical protein
MKQLIFSCILLVGCSANDAVPTTPAPPAPFDPATATLLKMGSLEGVGHTVSGTAGIYESNGKKYVLLNPFSSQNGPDLKVYLSKDVNASAYIKLGNLKSTNGSQSYEVPGMPDIAEYTHLHIWCEQFSVVFGRAALN